MSGLHVHREGNQAFREAMASLEKHQCVRGLSFTSFLILPFQRITRLKLLVQVRVVERDTENMEPCGEFVSNRIRTVFTEYPEKSGRKLRKGGQRHQSPSATGAGNHQRALWLQEASCLKTCLLKS